jgi:beta-lactam-binding protein with PASTA domain
MLGESVRRRQPRARPRRPAGRPRAWRTLLLALPLAVLLPFVIGYVIAVRVLFPPLEATGAGLPVPHLVGESATAAQRDLVAAGLGPLEVTELPHPSVPAGQVIAQSPVAGQQLRAGAGVRVAVSAGPPRVLVPDVTGFSADRAESLLRRVGFVVSLQLQESPVPAGRVIRTEPAPAQSLVLPAEVTMIVSSGPPPPLLPPDTLPDPTTPPAGLDPHSR